MISIKSFKNPFVLHPFLFGLFTTIFLFSHNIGLVKFQDLFSPISVIIITVIILLVIINLILKNKNKSALIVSLGLILFFSYGFIYEIIDSSFESNLKHKYIIAVFVIVFLISTFYLIKTHRILDNATKITNAIGVVIILISLSNIVVYSIEGDSFTNDFSTDNQIITTDNKVNLPDVYYIILDAYAGTESLENEFNFDNSKFYDFLTEKGFYVTKKSHSNYPSTHQSIASSLNMEYIDQIYSSGSLQKRMDNAYEIIDNNKVMKNFKSNGYTIININSGWGPSREISNADINLCTNYRGVSDSELFSMIVNKSMLNPVYVKIFEEDRRELLLCHFSTLSEVNKMTDDPIFVFSHITTPHAPYIFGPNGEKVTPKSLELGYEVKDKEGYIGQLQYTNKLVEDTIEEILTKYDIPPIIIIQGDHGSGETESELSWQDHDDDALKERFSILNAFLVPENEDEIFYETITPVNTFRILFNHIFNDKYDLLEDRLYVAESEFPWNFIEKTELILQN